MNNQFTNSSTSTFTTDSVTHLIENYIEYARSKKYDIQHALTELIDLYINHNPGHFILSLSSDNRALQLKELINNRNHTTKTSIWEAIKEACYKYAHPVPFSELKYPNDSIAKILAAFVREEKEVKKYSNSKTPKLTYEYHLNKLFGLPELHQECLMYFIEQFNPQIMVTGRLNEEDSLKPFQMLALNMPEGASITYRLENLHQIGSEHRKLFLQTIEHASAITLDGNSLDQWTTDDFKHFIHALKHNKHLNTLSLKRTELDEVCLNPGKFEYILELFSLERLEKLSLFQNNLNSLSEEMRKLLSEAVNKSRINLIQCQLDPERSNSGSLRLFNRSTSIKSNENSRTPEVSQGRL